MRTILILLVVLYAAVAAAQTDQTRAQRLFQEARQAYEAGDYEGSLAKLREAYKLFPNPVIAVAIARRLIDVDDPEGALAQLEAIESPPRRLRGVIQEETTRITDILAQPVPIVLDTVPPGAMVKLGDASAEQAPIRRSVPRGTLRVRVTLPGYAEQTIELQVKGTRAIQKTFTLVRVASQLIIEIVGTLPDRDPPIQAMVTLDGNPVTPGQPLEVDAGRHEIACSFPGAVAPTTLRVRVPAGKNATVRCALPAPMEEPIHWKTPVGWATVSGGAAALAAGIGLFISYAMDQGAYEEPRYTIDSSSKPLAGGIVTGVGAGLVGLGTYFLLSD